MNITRGARFITATLIIPKQKEEMTMKTILTLALTFALAVTSSQAMAASEKCIVTAVDNGTITLDCGTTTDSFKIGDEVKIKTAVKTQKKAIEGC
jgi:hypothetical protein